MIALTFDDGPSGWTGPLLDVLARRKARATFFCLGAAIPGREDTLRRAAADGHELGTHGWSHARLRGLADAAVKDELERASFLIKRAAAAEVRFWRAPHLDIDERLVALGDTLGLKHVGADVAPADWREPEDAIVNAVCAQARDGAVVGLHDGAPPWQRASSRAATVAAVARILDQLEGPFVTVAELC